MRPRTLALAAVLLAGGCAAWRYKSGGPVPPPSPALAQATPERRAAALFYSDLGPDAVDVSAYPPARRRDYEVFLRVCSRCHTPARAINAPYVDRAWWEFYTARMRVRARFHGDGLSKKDLRSVLDFLEHDSNERKIARAAEFEAVKSELKRRFEDELDERMEKLQRSAPPLGR